MDELMSGQVTILSKTKLEHFLKEKIEEKYNIKITSNIRATVNYKGTYNNIKRFALASCEDQK